MNELISGNVVTMSSREIAELTGKEHAHVMRDIREMAEAIKCTNPKMDACVKSTTYTGKDGRAYPMYELDKDTCLTLLLGYDAAARFKVVKRWQELESANKPKTTLEIIAAQTQVLIAQEREITRLKEVQAEQEDRIVRVEAKQQAFEEGFKYFTVLGYAAYKGITVALSDAQTIGKQAARLSKERNVPIDKVADQRFGRVNSYHESILDDIIASTL